LELNRTHQVLVCAVDILSNHKKHRSSLSEASREVGLEVNTEKTKWMVIFCPKMQDTIIIF